MADFREEFIGFAVARGVIRFGQFTTKAGRISPYFFNAGLFNDGASLGRLAEFYAKAILASGVAFDMMYGPAYKGIPLVTATAVALDRLGRNVAFAFNRREAKDHGEGGMLIGAPLAGCVLILDDVISAGTSVRESVDVIRAQGAEPAGVAIALDRMEKGKSELSAVQEVRQMFSIPVIAVASLDDLVGYLSLRTPNSEPAATLAAISDYRQQYGVRD